MASTWSFCGSSISPARFARLLNLANGVAYGGGMGMPEWVMLDVRFSPHFRGFMGPSSLLSFSDQNLLRESLKEMEEMRSSSRTYIERELGVSEGDLNPAEWFPIAGFCAMP